MKIRMLIALAVSTMPAAMTVHAEDSNSLSFGYGIVTSPGTDAKSPAPGAVTVKYGFGTDKVFKPYIGAGLAYSQSPASENKSVNSPGFKTGVAYQMGFNLKLDENASLNFDYKLLSLPSDARQSGTESAPTLLGVGLKFRF